MKNKQTSSLTVWKWTGCTCLCSLSLIYENVDYAMMGISIAWIGYMIETAVKELKGEI